MPQPTAPVKEAAKIIADIMVAQLGLLPGQIMLTNQKWFIPDNQGLYVAISYVSGKVIGNNNFSVPSSGGMTEMQQLLMLYQIQIDLMSYDDSARVKKELAYMGLMSVASEYIQETYNVQVARNPQPFQDVSMLEESSRLNRYTTLIAVTQLITNQNPNVPYYSDFSQAVPPEITDQQ
jgi:hypothetical protein